MGKMTSSSTVAAIVIPPSKKQELESVPEPQVQFCDMKDELKDLAINIAKNQYLLKEKVSDCFSAVLSAVRVQGEISHWKSAAETLKNEFDEKDGSTWHAIVGTHFGSFVTFDAKHVIFFQIGHMVRAAALSDARCLCCFLRCAESVAIQARLNENRGNCGFVFDLILCRVALSEIDRKSVV